MELEKLAIKIQVDSDDAEKKTTKLATSLKSLGTVAVAGVTAMAAGVTAIGKSAVESYADYEQLVGGVETLFKDSAGTVSKYASEAFKTTGQSANDYMETVTSFSASLLQSLGGDTEAAAEYANRAMVDMSDNANKMGSSMESIENAYKGFAKQNYTMLDNLKLGYGGTKEEMQRLLDDATKLSGIEYDISSYADIVDAIHVVQEEMGIAGTTALEASTTISGSVASMKASWQNLITGLADENANVPELISSFTDSIITVGSNLLPVIQQVLVSISDLIVQLMPQMLDMIPPLVMDVLPPLLESAVSILTTVVQTIIENLPLFIDIIIGLTDMLINSASENLPTLITSIIEGITQIIDNITTKLPEFLDLVVGLAKDLASTIITNLPTLISSVASLLAELIIYIGEHVPDFVKAGVELFTSLIKNLPEIIQGIVKHIPEIIVAILDGFGELGVKMLDVGDNLVKGLWNGINNAKTWITNKVKGWVGSVTKSIKSFFGINSPSKVTAQMGDYLVQGLGLGIKNNTYKAIDSVKAMAGAVEDAFAPNIASDNLMASGSYTSSLKIDSSTNQSDLIGSLAIMCRQILSAIDEKDLSITIGDETIAKSTARGNNSYLRRTGVSLI